MTPTRLVSNILSVLTQIKNIEFRASDSKIKQENENEEETRENAKALRSAFHGVYDNHYSSIRNEKNTEFLGLFEKDWLPKLEVEVFDLRNGSGGQPIKPLVSQKKDRWFGR